MDGSACSDVSRAVIDFETSHPPSLRHLALCRAFFSISLSSVVYVWGGCFVRNTFFVHSLRICLQQTTPSLEVSIPLQARREREREGEREKEEEEEEEEEG